jgi:hypothetical protein
MPRLHRKTISVSLITFFSFLRWELHSKERGFTMLDILRKTWWPNWALFVWTPLLIVFKIFFERLNKFIDRGRD